VIEQAKGVLMGRHGVDEKQAFELLRQQSQRLNVKLRTLATEVVSGAHAALTDDELPA
jgi:AmiR/NasT family two-component response regulator